MASQDGRFLDKVIQQRMLRRWERAARDASTVDLDTLRQQRQRARQLKSQLDHLLRAAEERLALPVQGTNSIPQPYNSDWAWRPDIWRGPAPVPGLSAVENKASFGDQVKIFHDCPWSEITLRQVRNTRERDLAVYGLRMDVFRFEGSYLSIVVDLPPDAVTDLKRTHLIRLDAVAELESPLEVFARLNVQHGPNTEQLVRELPLADETITVEFDLAYTNMNEKRIEKAWVDLIFEDPAMNQLVLRDLTFSRRPRALL